MLKTTLQTPSPALSANWRRRERKLLGFGKNEKAKYQAQK